MPIVKYTDENGLRWAVLVQEGTPEEEYEQGAVLGSPNLSSLGLSEAKTKRLHNALVDADLYVAPLLMGQRVILKRLLTTQQIDLGLLRPLIALFQADYYGALNG